MKREIAVQPAEMIGVGDVLRQRAGRRLREVRRYGGAAGEAAVGGVDVELCHTAGVRVDGLPAPPHHTRDQFSRIGLKIDIWSGQAKAR